MSFNLMHPMSWIPSTPGRLLDVGCNVGELLAECRRSNPPLKLVGVDVNACAVEQARINVPGAQILHTSGHTLPFKDCEFTCVTCIEVIERIPEKLRQQTLQEICRVLEPGGRFVLRCPHRGAFDWLDSNNLHLRFPRLYKRILGKGLRSKGYAEEQKGVVWHHHFTKCELQNLLGGGFALEEMRQGGSLVFPIADILSWPFYRLHLPRSPVLRLVQEIANWDLGID